MMPSCPYYVLSTPSSLNMWTCLWNLVFARGQARSKLGGVDTSILHHIFMLIFIASLVVISLHGTILMPFLSYFARFTWRGRMPDTGILAWKWSKVEIPILHNYKRRKNQRGFFRIYKNYWAEEVPEGRQGVATSLHGAATLPGRAMGACGHPAGPLAPLFCYMEGFVQEKIREELFRGFATATRRNLSRTNLELWQDDSVGETSLPEGEIVSIVITNTPLIGGDSSPSTSSSAPSHLQTLVHLL